VATHEAYSSGGMQALAGSSARAQSSSEHMRLGEERKGGTESDTMLKG
jgi:hypothetical protein